ncbi:MAG: hypothetical protein ACR2MP_34095 [Streptosporangiaceae bacterium]
MTRRQDDGPPTPEKPLTEMTPQELDAFRRSFNRWRRDRDVRSGRRKPRSMRETEIFLDGVERRFR